MTSHLPIATTIESRDGEMDQDACMKNAMIERDGNVTASFKRPGTVSTGVPPSAGEAQGLSTVDLAVAILVVGDNVVEADVAGAAIDNTFAMSPLFPGLPASINSKNGKDGSLVIKTNKEAWLYTP